MFNRNLTVTGLSHFINSHLIWLLIGAYATASIWPTFGLWIRSTSFANITLFQGRATLSLPTLMLGALLFAAGLGIQTAHLRRLLRRKHVLLAGLIANVVIPIGFIFAGVQALRIWHNPDEVQNLLVGFAVVASMPIAGSSTAWAQNANGNLALSLGLVLISTFLSPLTTPLALHLCGAMATGEYAAALRQLASYGTGTFLGMWVVLPSLLGILVRQAIGETRIAAVTPHLKLGNSINLLLLNYSNASVSLPQALEDPDLDFLVLTVVLAGGLCMTAFGAGYVLAHLLKVDRPQGTALMYGLGMNNNGTGLVLASLTLAAYPQVMLPIIFFTLIQHIIAGGVHFVLCRRPTNQEF